METTASSQSTTCVDFFAIEKGQYLDDSVEEISVLFPLYTDLAITIQQLAKVFRERIHFYTSREFIWEAKKKYLMFQPLSTQHWT